MSSFMLNRRDRILVLVISVNIMDLWVIGGTDEGSWSLSDEISAKPFLGKPFSLFISLDCYLDL